ncbi:MAG: hypothetical protein U0T84_06520 [Chitinophagales bacterium]
MKKAVVAFGIALLLFISACSNKNCSKTVCGYNQTCNNGQCYCVNGYEGDSCNKLSYPKFIGTYFTTATCSGPGGTSYTCYIQQGSTDVSQLVIANFLGQFDLVGYIKSSTDKKGTYLEIPQQGLGGSSDNTINGGGNFEVIGVQQRIQLNLNYRLSGSDYACSHTLVKQ